jgi:hypothetical protein
MPAALVRFAPEWAPPGGDPFAELENLMRGPSPAPGSVRAAARQASDRLDGWLKQLRDAGPLPAAKVRGLLDAAVADGLVHGPRDWDGAAQHYLAVAALYSALGGLDPATASPQRRALCAGLRQPLAFPADRGRLVRFDSPVEFTPDKYRQALQRFRDGFGP